MILKQTLDAFGISKSHTTAYHPEGDGLVEQFNRTLLQLLRTYVEQESEWEEHLPLALYAYRTAIHTTTGVSPYVLMFGRQPQLSVFDSPHAFDSTTYQFHLRTKLAKLKDIVESNLVSSAADQKQFYDRRSRVCSFQVGDLPRAGKLDPKWEGNWKVVSVKNPVNVEISDGVRTKVVHINRVQHRVQPTNTNSSRHDETTQLWQPPQIEHFTESTSPQPRRNPPRSRRPPDYYRP